MTIIRCGLIILLLMITQQTIAAPVTISKLTVSKQTGHTRLIFTANRVLQYSIFTLQSPARLVVDFPAAKLSHYFRQPGFAATPIKSLRTSTKHNHTLRLVFDLQSMVRTRATKTAGGKHGAKKLIISLTPLNGKYRHHQSTQAKHSSVHPSEIAATVPETEASSSAHPVVTMAAQRKLRPIIVVIDPGHGGKDPGASGARGTHEKNVVLAISKELQRVINQQNGMRAVLTRSSDYYITLRQRLSIARKDKGDIFIAIHADAYKNRNSHGASVFALSQRGATSEAARWLAERENYSELGGVKLSDKSYVLRSVLLDLSQTATIGASLHLGGSVMRQLANITSLHIHRIEQARFVVLKSPDIPSILVETGFISNPREEMKLRSPQYQQQLANAILHGVMHYFRRYPPDGSVFAKERA